MTVSEFEWAEREEERRAASAGDPAAWASLFGWLWIWTVQLAKCEDGAMGGWLNVVRRPSLWLNPLGAFALVFKNAGRDIRRKDCRHKGRIDALRASGSVGIQVGSDAEMQAILAQALGTFSPEDRSLTELYFKGLTFTEISKQCALPYASTRTRLRTVLAALREIFRRENGGEGWAAPAI